MQYIFVTKRVEISNHALDIENIPLNSQKVKKAIKDWLYKVCDSTNMDIASFVDDVANICASPIKATSIKQDIEVVTEVIRKTQSIVVHNYARSFEIIPA